MPYLVWNTVFDNTRVTAELGRKPVPFSNTVFRCSSSAAKINFEYKYRPWPARRRRYRRMMDFILEAWVSSNIERAEAGWMLGAGNAGSRARS